MGSFLSFLAGIKWISVYWTIAVPATILMAIYFAMIVFGFGDSDTDMEDIESDADHSGGEFQLVSLRSLIAFFTVFGWSGIACISQGTAALGSFLIATGLGTSMMALTAFLAFTLKKLALEGTPITANDAIGCTGTVYIPINPQKDIYGKVQINVRGATREFAAIMNECGSKEVVKTGTLVKIMSAPNDHLVVVERV